MAGERFPVGRGADEEEPLAQQVRLALSFVIPFAFASFYPTARFLGRAEFLPHFWAVPFVAAISLAIALSLWKSGVKRYHSTGS